MQSSGAAFRSNAAIYGDPVDAEADYEAVFDLHAAGAIGSTLLRGALAERGKLSKRPANPEAPLPGFEPGFPD